MSRENVELVRSIYAAWERGDFGETDWVDPEIDCRFVGDTPTAGTSKGLDGMATAWREWLSAWQDFHVEDAEYRELDEERVLVLARFAGRGKTSGLEIGQVWTRAASVFQIQNGKVTKLLLYTDHERALADLSPSEQDAHADS
jgi:ketosteroid isomerase-like protein